MNIKSKSKIAIFTTFIAALSSTSLYAETAKNETVRELLVASGHKVSLSNSVKMMLPMLKKAAKNLPSELIHEISDVESIINVTIPIYKKYYSEEELQELLKFFNSPIGKKYAANAVKIQREAMIAVAQRNRMAIINYNIQKGNIKINENEQ